MDEKVLNKIQKLLAMGNGTAVGGQAEADTALAKAYELMRQNNIDMAQVQSASRENILGALDENKITPPPMKSWEQRLLGAIVKLFDCDHIYNHSRCGNCHQISVFIIGRESNRITAEIMYKWLRQKIYEDSFAYKASQRQGYCLGVVAGIWVKVHQLKKNSAPTDAWGLVPMDEVAQWMKQRYPNLYTTDSRATAQDYSAYNAGKADGLATNLNKQMQATALPCA